MERPDDLMATHAAELLISWLDSDRAPEAHAYAFVCPLVEGASVAGPRGG